MFTQYFITIMIPLVFSSVVAAFGWFAYAEMGAVVSGVSTLVISMVWASFSLLTSVQRNIRSKIDPRRVVALAKRIAKRTPKTA